MGYLKYKGYLGSVEYNEEDQCLFGKVLGMSKDIISYEGKTVDELKEDFETGIDAYLDSCKKEGIEPRKAYSGTLNVRLTPEIHNQIANIAQESGITINAYIKNTLQKQLEQEID
jgi:predicted HicB family RNase H-like nuclease